MTDIIQAVSGVCIRQEDTVRFLMAKRKEDSIYLPGKWELPGGKVEAGESLQDAMEREWEEELGVKAKASNAPIASLYAKPRGARFDIHLFRMNPESYDFQLLEVAELRWVTFPEAVMYYDISTHSFPVFVEAAKLTVLSIG